MNKAFDYLRNIPEMNTLIEQANRKDVRAVESDKTLREFIAGMISYMPGWIRFLFKVRGVFVRLLGTRQETMHFTQGVRPEDVSFTPGHEATYFTVVGGGEDEYWICEARDRMISGYLAVAREPLPDGEGKSRYHVLCMARYRHWTARIYYNVIYLPHHVVVHYMVKNALKQE